MITALAAVPLIGLMSAALDYSALTKERSQLSSALDAAVLAAANNNAITLNEKDAYAESHFRANYTGDIVVDLSPSVTSSRVRLEATGELALTFGSMIGVRNPKISEASAATLAVNNTICVLALSETADEAIFFDRELEFLASGCAVHSNSTSEKAIAAYNNLSLPTATSFCAVGGISGNVEPHSKGECSRVSDPYDSIVPAQVGDCKSEFLIEGVGQASSGANLDPMGAVDPVLPQTNPMSVDNIVTELRKTHTGRNFATNRGPVDEQLGTIEKVAVLGGQDMQMLLKAYDAYGEWIECAENPKPECYGFNNPFLNTPMQDNPPRSLVAEIFAISYGNAGAAPDLPDIVRSGVVELISGQLYSRNNVDNELVTVSSNLTGGDILLTPGTYCGGLTVDGLRVRFSPGDYIFKDGPLTFLNQSEATADRVTFGFTGNGATLNIESGSKLTIRSATDGPREGLAFMQMIDPDVPGNREPTRGINRIASGGSVAMSGTAYFPEQTLLISGANTSLGASSPAVGLIANEIKFRGDENARVKIAADHQQAGIPPIQPQVDDGVRLVE